MKNFILSCLFIMACSCTGLSQRIDPVKIKKHIAILASDDFQGRGTGTEGEAKAASYIATEFKRLKLQPKGTDGGFLHQFKFKKGAHGEGEEGVSKNVVAYIDNQAEHTIIIGAHYDHLGLGEQGSSLDANPAQKIHNGADDNASGVAGVLELARYFANNKTKEKNNFLFICFSGEELGLIGSARYVESATIDLSTTNFMINMDMVGRLDPNTKTLVVNGTGTSSVWEPLLQQFNGKPLQIKTDSSGTGPSDHTSFYLKNIPVLHFFTGTHQDYHKPSDDAEKINAEGEANVLELIISIIESLDGKGKIDFLKTRTKQQSSRASFKVTMGVMPSYASDVEGLKVDGVTDGKPASAAGIQTGDVIIQIGEYKVKDVYSYMDALGKFEKGQTVDVVVLRKDERKVFRVTF